MEYREFDFWYYRFLNGEYDLDYERDKDKKIHELSNMPIDVMEEIVEHLDIFNRLVVRNVSRDLRELIDKRATSVKRIEFSIQSWRNTFSVCIDNVITNYKESSKPKTSESHFRRFHNDSKDTLLTFIEGPDAMKKSLIHLAHYLQNPNLKLKFLEIGVCTADYQGYEHDDWSIVQKCHKKLEPFLLSLKHQISTEMFSGSNVSERRFLMTLKSLKPGVLKSIGGEVYWSKIGIINEIVGTEQWKQAKRFISWGGMPALIDGVAHFEEFAMDWYDNNPGSVVRLRQLLFESKAFKKGQLSLLNPPDFDIIDRAVEALGPRIFRYPEDPLKWSYPIPDTNEFLDFHQDGGMDVFYIERTT
ncbi:unnamed protein product [Caenorhabditis brenneri]